MQRIMMSSTYFFPFPTPNTNCTRAQLLLQEVRALAVTFILKPQASNRTGGNQRHQITSDAGHPYGICVKPKNLAEAFIKSHNPFSASFCSPPCAPDFHLYTVIRVLGLISLHILLSVVVYRLGDLPTLH